MNNMNQLQFVTLQANLTCNGLVINLNNVGVGGAGDGGQNLGGGGIGGNVGEFGGVGGGFGGAGVLGVGAISALNLFLQAQTLILNINNHGAPFQWPGAPVNGPGPAPFQWPGPPMDLGPVPAPVEGLAPLNVPVSAGQPLSDLDAMENINAFADDIDWEAFNVMLDQQLAPNGQEPNPEDNSDITD